MCELFIIYYNLQKFLFLFQCLMVVVLFACYSAIESGSPSTLDYFWSPDNGEEIKSNEVTDTENGYTLE